MTSRLIANGNQEKRHLVARFWDVWKPSPTQNFINTPFVVTPTLIIEPFFFISSIIVLTAVKTIAKVSNNTTSAIMTSSPPFTRELKQPPPFPYEYYYSTIHCRRQQKQSFCKYLIFILFYQIRIIDNFFVQ